MKALRVVFRLGLLFAFALPMPGMPTIAQTTSPKEAQPPAPGLRKLTGEDEKRAKQLDEQIDRALKADRWDEAIAKTEDLLALRVKAQGPKHFETANVEWRLKVLRRVATTPKEDRAALVSAKTMDAQAEAFRDQGKYAAAQPLYEKALAIRRRLLTDDHPDTAIGYDSVALDLNAQGKYAAAQPLYEKALAIRRRLLTDDHPSTALSYNNVAHNLNAQGKYAAAQPLFEKALEIRRRLLGVDHTDTAAGYNNVAFNLYAQGKYAAAQPLFEKALEIYRRLFTDDHASTTLSYNNVASNLNAQGKYAAAQPLFEKALEIRRRLLTDDHPHTAYSYNNLAFNLNAQGKYAAAQPLFEKALEIFRRLLTDDHPNTAAFYTSLAYNLEAQGKYAAAQPLFEKALEICRRLLTDDHPDTARGYGSVAANLSAQGKSAAAQPLFEKALETRRRLLGEEHPYTAGSYNDMASNLQAQGKYAAAQPLFEKALEICRRLKTDDHPDTARYYNGVAYNLSAQAKYREARDRWISAVRILDAARLRIAFTGLERAEKGNRVRPALAAVLARLGQPVEAWQHLEEDLGRGLLDELTAREDRRLAPGDRSRLRELTAELERLDRLVESTPKGLDQAGRAKRFEELKRQHVLASIALGEFQTKLVHDHGPLAGEAAQLKEIQAALPADAALVAWVDLAPVSPNAADPNGEHWGVVVRSRGVPAWITMAGTGPNGLWTQEHTGLANRVRTALRNRASAGSADLRPLVERLRTQRLGPLAQALGAGADGLPPARRLIVLPSRAMTGIPIEVLLAKGDSRTVSYAPSATVFQYLRQLPRPDRRAGLLAVGDPVFDRPDASSPPHAMPDHGLLITIVLPGSNAASHGLKPGDVLLAYNGGALNKKEDLNVVSEGNQPIGVEVWREGRSFRRDLAPGNLGVVLDPRPAPETIAEQRKLHRVLTAARSGDEDFAPLPGTRYEVEALTQVFKSADRPTRTLLGPDASEPELDRIASSGELRHFSFIHLATHGVIDEAAPQRSAVILTQAGLPDPLEQALNHKPVFDGRLTVREIQRTWDLKAELVTLSACETALGRESGGEGFVGFTQALLMSGARSVCLSLWRVDDKATSLLMTRFYQNLLGKRAGLANAMPKAEALQEAKQWLRSLTVDQIDGELAALQRGDVRPLAKVDGTPSPGAATSPKSSGNRPYDHPYFWAAFVLVGDPD